MPERGAIAETWSKRIELDELARGLEPIRDVPDAAVRIPAAEGGRDDR